MSAEILQSENAIQQEKGKITYKPLDHLPNGGLHALENGCYEIDVPNDGRLYTVSIFVNHEASDDELPWVMLGGLNDRRRVYEHVCDELAQHGVVVYIEQKKGNANKTKSVFEQEANDICHIVKDKLSIQKAILFAHSLSTIRAAYAAKNEFAIASKLFPTVVLAAPIALEKGPLGPPFRQNRRLVKDLAHGRNMDGAEEPERARKALRSLSVHFWEVLGKFIHTLEHRKEAETGVLGEELLPHLAEFGVSDIALLMPEYDPYNNNVDIHSHLKKLDPILGERENPPGIFFLKPVIGDKKLPLHGWVNLGNSLDVVSVVTTVVEQLADVRTLIAENPNLIQPVYSEDVVKDQAA